MNLTIRRPDDWHIHLRDGAMLATVLPHTARQFARAIVMPNLLPPVTTAEMAKAYCERIRAALPTGLDFTPLMTAYLTDHTDPDDLQRGFQEGVFTAAKLYPAHATTNSAHGVSNIAAIGPVLERMQSMGMPLLLHGEVTDPTVDIFDREAVYLDRVLAPLIIRYPKLRIVLEHATTAEAIAFVRAHPRNLAATITAHHLMINRTDIFKGGIHPHLYCLPIAKREKHRLALRQAATSGEPNFFLGTDTAPHTAGAKESSCGCAGVYTALTALELYAEVFEEEDALPRFEAFASLNGPRFYQLPINEGMVTLEKTDWTVPEVIPVGSGGDVLKPFRAGETLRWRLKEENV